jgi:hypothetical protein
MGVVGAVSVGRKDLRAVGHASEAEEPGLGGVEVGEGPEGQAMGAGHGDVGVDHLVARAVASGVP